MISNKILIIVIAVLLALILIGAAAWFWYPGSVPATNNNQPNNNQPNDDLTAYNDLILVDNLRANDTISSPLEIRGQARGNWFFEASFPIKLYDENGALLAVAVAQAQGDPSHEGGAGWMTEDFVPFAAQLTFNYPTTEAGILVLEKDNPSGLPEHADEFRIPVRFAATAETKTIKLYYYNAERDKDEASNIQCGPAGLVAVERAVPLTQTPIQDSIRLLLAGELSPAELAQGISTEYPLTGLELLGAALNNGVLTLEFSDPSNKTGGGACRVGILWRQIEATAKQFPEVKEVRFLPEELFQP